MARVDATHTDLWVLGFTLVLSLATGVLFGIAPAWSASSPDLQDALRDASRSAGGPRAARLRSGLVILETALALILLAGAGVLLKTFLTLRGTAPGFDSANVLVLNLWIPQPRFAKLPDRSQLYDGVLARVRGLPGVRSAGLVADLPLNGGTDSLAFHVVGRPTLPRQVLQRRFQRGHGGLFQDDGDRGARSRSSPRPIAGTRRR